MNRFTALSSIVGASVVVSTSNLVAHAASEEHGTPWVVHLTADGSLTSESRQAAVKIRQKAADAGYITLWLLPNSDDGWNPTNLTDEQHAQNCAEILWPLVDRKIVWHPPGGPNNSGPVCLVRASVAGVDLLLQDERLAQIMGAH